MKTNQLAVPASLCGASYLRVSTSTTPVGNPFSVLIHSAWKRRAAALCFCALALSGPASALTVAWDCNPESDIACYELRYGTSPGVHPNVIDAGLDTSVAVTGLLEGTTYYFVVTACNQAGLESDPSAEISYQVPVTPVDPVDPVEVIPPAGWSLQFVDSEETNGYPASYAFDGNPDTFWHTAWRTVAPAPPHDLQIDLGAVFSIQGFRYLPRQDNYLVGNITQYEFHLSMDGSNWGNPVATGTFAGSNTEKEVRFTAGSARYVRLRSLSEADDGACNVAELNLLGMIATNQAPIATALTATTAANTPLAIVLAASDADGDSLTYSIVSGPAHGSLGGSAPNVTYTPASNYSGTDSFTFKANDGTSDSAAATVSLTVTPAIVAPVVAIPRTGWSLQSVDSEEANGYPASYAFDGNPNTFWHTAWRTVAPPPPHDLQIDLGTVFSIQGFRYLPRQDNYLVGNITQYEFHLSMDGSNWGNPVAAGTFAGSNTEKEVLFATGNARYVRLRSLGAADGGACNVAELNLLGMIATNQAPIATAKTATTAEDTPLAIVLSATDAEGTALTYMIATPPAHGTLGGSAPNVTYTPAPNYNGSDSFTFKAHDGTTASAPATVSLTVTPANDAPVLAADPIHLSTTEDTAFSGQLAAADIDANDSLTFTKVSGPAWLTVSGSGALAGTPSNAAAGANAFVIRVTDGGGAFDEAALILTVANVNDAPVFTTDPILAADAKETVAYAGQTLAGLATDADAGDTLSYSKVSGPDWLAVAANGALSGTPAAGTAGLHTFVVRVTDSASATDDAELRIQVAGLPLPWVTADLGTGQLAGSATYAAGTFSQAGSGKFGGSSDTLRFTYQTLSGDGEIIAKVSALQNTGTSSRVGVMIRNSLATNSMQTFFGMTGSNAYRWVRRTSTGGSNSTTNSSTGTVPNTWVRLVRSGNKITAYKGTNGTTWTTVGSTTVTMAANCYIGLAVTSGSATTLNTSQFSNVSVTP